MNTKAFKVEIIYRATVMVREGDKCFSQDGGVDGACDWMSGLLSEDGINSKNPFLLDWAYDQCGGEYIPPQERENGVYTAVVWILPLPGKSDDDVFDFLAKSNGLVECRILERKNVEISYREDDFLSEIFPARG